MIDKKLEGKSGAKLGSDSASEMRVLKKDFQVTRRGFLQSASMGAAAVATVSVSSIALSPSNAIAQSLPDLGKDIGTTLVKMARDIFPHDKIPDKFYIQAIETYNTGVKTDPELKKLLTEGVASLNAAAQKVHKVSYVEVKTEQERVQILKSIEPSPFFQKIKGGLVTGLYNNKAIWPLFGYEGSSWEKGGYVNRGFDDLNWL
jgi:hypothetical protein